MVDEDNQNTYEPAHFASATESEEVAQSTEFEEVAKTGDASESEQPSEFARAVEVEDTADLGRVLDSERTAEFEPIAEPEPVAEPELIAEPEPIAEPERAAAPERPAEPEAPAQSTRPAKKVKHKHIRNAFLTELFRSIGTTLTRFLAIMGIVGLGVGFYAGLNMTGQDMRTASDIYYDGTRLYDLRVISTLGLSDNQVETIAATEGVEQAKGAYATDVIALLGEDRYVVHVMSCDLDAAREASVDTNGAVVESADDSYINRLVLVEGSWPTSVNECVLSADRAMNKPLKPGDTVEVLYGTGDLDDVLEVRTFTVSGLIRSSAYPSNVMLGYSNLGSGSVEQIMYVYDEAFADTLPYTEVYVTVEGARDYRCESDEYQARVDEVAANIESLDIAAERLDEVILAAQEELDAAQVEYDENEAEANTELSDAEAELADAYAELEKARADIEEGRAEYEDGVKELEQARKDVEEQLASARAELEQAQLEVESGEAQLGMSQADLDAAYSEFYAGEATWNSQRAELVQVRSDVLTLRSSVDALLVYATLGRELSDAEINDASSKAQAAEAAANRLSNSTILDQFSSSTQAQVQSIANSTLNDLYSIDFTQSPESIYRQLRLVVPGTATRVDAAVDDTVYQIDVAVSQGDATISSARSELAVAQSARDELDAAHREIEQGWTTYYEEEARANQELADAQASLDEAAAKLADATEQYEEGREEFNEGYRTYIESRDEVEQSFADAAAQIKAAQADIDALEEPTIYVLDRTKSPGLVAYQDDTYRMDSIASVFPFLFFLVAALVSLTTMTRMVEDERADIGTHKALGFSTARITAKYVAYAGLAGIVGSIVGITFLSQLLPWVVQVAYHIMYSVPVLAFPQPIDLGISLFATLLGLGVIFIVIFAAAAATLREVPATLMLPRVPKAGKRILLERVTFIWSNLSFSWKVTFRNLFRYKQRMVMTVVGVAGCTALLLTGFGLHNAIWDIIAYQNESENMISRYNLTIGLGAGVTSKDAEAIEKVLADVGKATDFEYYDLENMQISSSSSDDTSTVQLHIVTDCDEFAKMIDLRERTTKQPIEFDLSSVVLTEKMARKLGVGVGDDIVVYERDELGNPVGDGYAMTLTGICENYVYHYLYVGMDAWKEATGDDCAVDTMITMVSTDDGVHKELTDELAEIEAVASVSFIAETIESYRTSLKAVNIIVVVLVVAAATLAFIVLYNLINIQLIERTREIASLKVLGFNRREVANYLFRETIILVVVGALVGLALGIVMEGFVVVTAEVDAVMFGRDIHLLSYVYAFSLAIVFAVVVMVVIVPKLQKIDMVESLKSVD